MSGQPTAGLVHGMGKELVEPDWAPLTGDEVSAVLSRYPRRAADGPSGDGAVVAWSSPRPMSAAGLVSRGADTVFVKRHHVRVRSAAQLAAEHAFAAVGRQRPGLGRYLAGRDWRGDLTRDLLPAARRAGQLLGALERRWGHGDWHPSNLTWDTAGPGAEVTAVFDFGLANRTFAVHDLALALERSTIAWLDLAECGEAGVDIDAVDALLDG